GIDVRQILVCLAIRLVASHPHRVRVGAVVVTVCEPALPAADPVAARHVAAAQRGLAGSVLHLAAFLLGFSGNEAVIISGAKQVWLEKLLSLGADKNYPLTPVVLGLMRCGTVSPYVARSINVLR